jgi:uncharacterized membrane protein
MIPDIREKAETNVAKRKGFYIVSSIFASISIILFTISLNFYGAIEYWIRFPILILALILGIIYVSMFGFSFQNFLNDDWEEEEIEKEMARLYRKKRKALPPPEDLTQTDRLELKEFERLKEKWEDPEDYV